MLIADMIHSCSNAKVAGAAVACIGGVFADRVACAAERKGMEVGDFVSVVVREFARGASHETISALARKISGADQPILQGLVHVLDVSLETDALIVDDRDFGFTGPFSAGFGGVLAWAH